MGKKSLEERLKEGILIGDGGFVMGLEKRGYVKGGLWTPEATVEHPYAVKQLHREFLRAGSDIMTTFTFYSNEDKLKITNKGTSKLVTTKDVNTSACRIAREVADEGDALVGGSISQNPCYLEGKGKEYEQNAVQKQIDVFVAEKIDFILFEFFNRIEEMEWCIEQGLKSGLPVVATLTIGPEGDRNGVPTEECAVRLAKTGALVVGLNCYFDPDTTIKTVKIMKNALKKAGLNPYFMVQPNGFLTTGMGVNGGYLMCPEYPYAMETRLCNRYEIRKFAREAYDLGVNIIGGCCGFEAYHIRAISEELHKERGKLPPGCEKSDLDLGCLKLSSCPQVAERGSHEYWFNLVPDSGRTKPPTYPTLK